jgi:hypothetical protein
MQDKLDVINAKKPISNDILLPKEAYLLGIIKHLLR